MFKCTTLHHSYSIQKCDKSFIYSKYLQKCHVLDYMSMPITLQYYNVCSKYPSRTHALRRARHFVNGCVNDALLQCCIVTSNDVIGTQKRQINLNKSIKQKHLPVYHSKTKLSSYVFWLISMNKPWSSGVRHNGRRRTLLTRELTE